jgi:hypothetical protein
MINTKNPIKDPGKNQIQSTQYLWNFQNIAKIPTIFIPHFFLFDPNLMLTSSIVTKKRLRICGNRLCGVEGFGNDGKEWSRKKVGG